MFSITEFIETKRDRGLLDAVDITSFVQGVSDNSISDAQIAAFTMAVYLNGLNAGEQVSLTLAMRDSGAVLNWDGIGGPVLDKHSTGGVGDLVSLALAPMVAACGGFVPMISGRGLGHTGGTLDKLESIEGFSVHPGLDQFSRIVREVGCGMIGQGPELAPADSRMYAVRDVTGTVSSIPLIVSSILSKKLAEGLDGLVLDIKTGNGAFMTDKAKAGKLAEEISGVSTRAGLPCRALLTDMNQPLCSRVGNALEAAEAIRFLTGEYRHPRLYEVTMSLASELLVMGALADTPESARGQLQDSLDSGAAAELFEKMTHAQGGPSDVLSRPWQSLKRAPVVNDCTAADAGYIQAIDTRELGLCVKGLGGGRDQVEDCIDSSVGLSGLRPLGDWVDQGEPLAIVHAANTADLQTASQRIKAAIRLGPERPPESPVIIGG